MISNAVVHVIDDDEAMRKSLALLLINAGFTVRAYPSASVFLLEVIGPFEGCVVTDVRMPGMTGLDLQSHLAARRIAIPVIVMTGHGDVRLAVAAMKAGASDFIEKPFSAGAMIEAVRNAVSRAVQSASREPEPQKAAGRLCGLTARETEVLDGLIAGLSNKTIAYEGIALKVR
jgi:two-component system response regulator FixJ